MREYVTVTKAMRYAKVMLQLACIISAALRTQEQLLVAASVSALLYVALLFADRKVRPDGPGLVMAAHMVPVAIATRAAPELWIFLAFDIALSIANVILFSS